jgi:hypothetical protein
LNKEDKKIIETSRELADRLRGAIRFILQSHAHYLMNMCKFSYASQRVFLYLIYQGFCGQDEKETEEEQKEREQDEKYLDGDGCGMGDG